MHKRRTAKSINKPPPIQGAVKKTTPAAEPEIPADILTQFEVELCWCVHQLQDALSGGKLSQKVAEDTAKNLKILTSPKAPLIQKRQVMKLSLGDYRAKMQKEEQKMQLAAKEIKFTPTSETVKKSSFVKKSALLTSGSDFRFNFSAPAEGSNAKEPQPAPNATERAPAPKALTNFQMSSGSPFKFNFTIDNDSANDINFSGLNLNN
ncbi:UPF0488 protein CG14286 [Drosophila biarmipes]|uniref:UPF0488 protein CG14286 n=1 Tax=Drosophila biarmipes TaxID=125945 RepID=UPI0007E68FE3|nr:UPF0488 protein CG14286 [Drosophila biarmipes]